MNSISTIFNKKIIDYVEEGESISAELIAKLEELYDDYEEEELI